MSKKTTELPNQISQWTFLSNHAHVLVCLHQNSESVLREVAYKVGITERAVQKIIKDLEDGKILTRKKDGRKNIYTLHTKVGLRHPLESHCNVIDLLNVIGKPIN